MTDTNGSGGNGGQPGAGGAGDSGQPWYNSIGDEGLRTYAQTKGFKDPTAVLESYRNAEKMLGVPQERVLKLPEKPDDPAWGEIHGRLGRPSEPSGYGLKFDGDAAFADRMAGVMHKAGVSKAQAEALNGEWNTYVQELIAQDTREREQRDATEMQQLRGKWGQQFDANAEMGRRAGREFGLSEDEFKAISGALGSGKTLELFQRIGAKVGEPASFDPSGAGGKGGFGMTPEAARGRIQSLMGDKDWTAKYLNGGVTEKEEMTRLQQIATGGA